MTFTKKFLGLPFERTQMHTGRKVHAKVTAGCKSKVPAALAHRLQKKQQKAPNTLKKTYWKVFFNLFGEVVVVWEGHSNGGELWAAILGASSEGCAQQQREAKSQGKSKPKGKEGFKNFRVSKCPFGSCRKKEKLWPNLKQLKKVKNGSFRE